MLIQLGDVAADQGDWDAADQAYQRAIEAAGADSVEAHERLRDLRVDDGDWRERVLEIQEEARDATPAERARSLVRAARVARRAAPEVAEELLRQAYSADPMRDDAAALYEGLLVAQDREASVVQTQRGLIQAAADPDRQAELALRFGARWGHRHKKPQLAAEFGEETLRHQPQNEAAFALLCDVYGSHFGDWSKVVGLADSLGARVPRPNAAFFLANAAAVALQELGDADRARGYYERLAEIAPEHPALARRGNHSGESPGSKNNPLRASERGGAPMTAQRPEVSELTGGTEPPSASEMNGSTDDRALEDSGLQLTQSAPNPSSNGHAAHPSGAPVSAVSSVPPVAPSVAPGARASDSPSSLRSDRPASAPPVMLDAAGIAAAREQLAKQESQNRVHEVVKTLIILGDAVSDTAERVQFYARAADLYANKFMNQAEAVKANEKIFALQPEHAGARDYLRQMYEKRRDWEKLVRLRQAEAAQLPSEGERAQLYKEIALLATERIKKPAICIALWEAVLDNDPQDPEALTELSKLYERDRNYDKLADVLTNLADRASGDERIQLLTKLGQVVGDRLKDEERAIAVYRALVELEPDNRRAQEQLKKRYLALGRWDDLDEFYAASGKWDEFIRVLESSEARAENTAERIVMLRKIAELWEQRRDKPDRAARAYEKILSIDANNREAAERLIPIYASSNNPKGLSNVLEVKLAYTDDPSERLEVLRQLVDLYENRLRDATRAFERARAAFELAPADPDTQAAVQRLAEVTGDFPALIASYRLAIDACEKSAEYPVAAALRLSLGRVHIEKMGNLEDALLEYRAVSEAQPDNVDALRALEQLYLQAQRHGDLLEVYGRLSALAETPEESRDIALQIASLHEHQLGDKAAAIESYQTVLGHDPLDKRALAALDRLYQETQDWPRYAEVIERQLELEASEREVVDLKFRLAEAQRRHLGDAERALDTYREVLT
ncbi:MAG TPA: tetratricopeptide repeat protein, partial [Polyangiaceae bacterium]|nr:tetratricopeptide repeat protein [Polyangiaceae bacterium]